ncbi:TPA: chromate transporter [Streptococcus suis]
MPQHIQNKQFLKDVFLCSLASYGGPEAHYGVFSRELIDKKKYISQEEMTELIGIFSLLPGPSSTQTITAIGYRLGGPWIALASFLIWILPALVIMTSLGIGLEWVAQNQAWNKLLIFLPAVAVSFILYAAIQLTRKVVTSKKDLILYISFCLLSFVLIPLSSWSILLLLLAGGLAGLVPVWGQAGQELQNIPKTSKVRWQLPATIIILAILFSAMANYFGGDSRLFASIYHYGYSIIGGGQIMIPLMIQDLVKQEGFLSQADFLAGYSLDQAVPGPLFSFASFVAARSVTGGIVVKFLAGLLGGGLIFLPGILLVYFATPLWQVYRQLHYVSSFLKGISWSVAAIISWTALNQLQGLSSGGECFICILATLLLLSKRIPSPLLVISVMLLGFFIG